DKNNTSLPAPRHQHPHSIDDYLRRYPRACAAIIAYSTGYATPHCAANILRDAHNKQSNYSEWIWTCYRSDPTPAVREAIKSRHHLKGYLSSYETALAIIRHHNNTGQSPPFASWM